MTINHKSEEITYEDLLAAGQNMGIGKRRCDRIIEEILSVRKNFLMYMERAGVHEKTATTLASVIAAIYS